MASLFLFVRNDRLSDIAGGSSANFPDRIMVPVILPQWATANRERQGALTDSRTTIAGDPFYREWLCGAVRAVGVVY